MANYNRTLTVTDKCSRTTLADLIGTAGVKNLTASDVEDLGALVVTAATSSPGTPTAGVWWWDEFDQLLKAPVCEVNGYSCSFWASVGPDAWDFPGYNVCGYTVHKGTFLRFDTTEGADIYGCTPMEPCTTFMTSGRTLRADQNMRNAYGFAAEHIPPQSYGPVRSEGFGHVRAEWATYDDLKGDNDNKYACYPLIPSTQYTGFVQCTPRGVANGQPTWITQVAAGMCRPDNITTTSVLAPALIRLPAGRVAQLK